MTELSQKFELWGTFSVWDHVRPGAFLAEVVMYDKLVIPVPPDPDHAKTPEDRAFAEEQWTRWAQNGWQPERLFEILKIIEPVTETIEWDRTHYEAWKAEFEESTSGSSNASRLVGRLLAGWVTGQTLLRHLPASAAGAVAIVPFDSLEQLEEELGITKTSRLIERQEASQGLPGELVSAVIGREFLVPEDPNRDEFDLLRSAVDLVQHENWRDARRTFHSGLMRFINDGRTDYDAIRSAVTAMASDLEALNKIARRQRFWKGVRRAFFFTQMALQVATAPINPFAVGQVAASMGQFTTSEILGNPASPHQAGAAGALLLDAQKKLSLTMH